MTYASELPKFVNKHLARVVLGLDAGNVSYSEYDHSADAGFEAGRLRSISGLTRSLDIDRSSVKTTEGSFALDNADLGISTLVNSSVADGRGVEVVSTFKTSGGLQTKTIAKGLMEIRTTDPTVIDIGILPRLRDSLGILQRPITDTNFPNALQDSNGIGQNIVLGRVNTLATNSGGVWLPIVDTTNRKLSVAQHACKAVANLIKIKGDVVTALTLTTDYTVNLNDTDGDGLTYTSVTLTVGAYDPEALYYSNAVDGLETNGDSTGTLITNPGTLIEEVIKRFSLLSASDIDSTSFTAFKAVCTARGYDTVGQWGGVIPWRKGEIIEDATIAFAELAANSDAVIYPTNEDKIAVRTADISETSAGSFVQVSQLDVTPEDMKTQRRPFQLMNKASVNYRLAHAIDGFELNRIGTDGGSIAAFGQTQDAELPYRFIRGNATLEDVAGRFLLRRGGFNAKVNFTTNGLQLMDCDLGEIIEITHPHIEDGWQKKQFMITSLTPDLIGTTEQIEAVSLGDAYGPVSFAEQLSESFYPSLDTYIDSLNPNTAYPNTSPLQHGEWKLFNSSLRAALRFDISALSTATSIVSATLKLNFQAAFNPTANLSVNQLLSTAWTAISTWNNFDGSAWSDSNIGSAITDLTQGGTGFRTFQFNSTGLTYLLAQKAGNVEFTLTGNLGNDERYTFNSFESIDNLKPTLRVVYLV